MTIEVGVGVDESRALRDARALARLSIAVARASTAQDVARILLDELTAAMPGASAGVALLDENGREFELDRRAPDRRARHDASATAGRSTSRRPPATSCSRAAPVSLTRDEYRARYPQVSSIADPETLARYVAIPIIPGIRPDRRRRPLVGRGPGPGRARRWPTSRTLVDAGAQALGRARLEDAERRTRYLLRAIVDQIPMGILIMEPDGSRPLYMNQAFGEIFALRADGVAGRPP